MSARPIRRRTRAHLALPLLLTLAEVVNLFVEAVLPRPDAVVPWSPLTLVFSLGLVIPAVFFCMVVAPRRVVDPEAPSKAWTWAVRYINMTASAAFGLLIVTPALSYFWSLLGE